jgi:hypothetical protein
MALAGYVVEPATSSDVDISTVSCLGPDAERYLIECPRCGSGRPLARQMARPNR